jgi:hypothetical protein
MFTLRKKKSRELGMNFTNTITMQVSIFRSKNHTPPPPSKMIFPPFPKYVKIYLTHHSRALKAMKR